MGPLESCGFRWATDSLRPPQRFYFGKLANAFFAWAPRGRPVVVELYNQRGEKFGEYANGMFTMGAAFSTPTECHAGEIGCPVATVRAVPPTVPQASARAVDTVYFERDRAESRVGKSSVASLKPGDPGYKDGGTATLLSFLITGAGQIYTGETGTGLLYFLGSTTAIGLGVGATDFDCYYECDYGPAIAGLAVGGVVWIASIMDAARLHAAKIASWLLLGSPLSRR